MAPLAHLALLCLGLACMTTLVTSERQDCSTPEWPRNFEGENPVVANRGKVVLVALMESDCQDCARQATRLQHLKTSLRQSGHDDIEMVLVTGGRNISHNSTNSLLQASSLPIVQDTTEDQTLFKQVFNANHGDFIIYDRCGQRAFVIAHPISYEDRRLAGHLLRMTSRGKHPCRCSLDTVRRGNRHQTRISPEKVLELERDLQLLLRQGTGHTAHNSRHKREGRGLRGSYSSEKSDSDSNITSYTYDIKLYSYDTDLSAYDSDSSSSDSDSGSHSRRKREADSESGSHSRRKRDEWSTSRRSVTCTCTCS